MALLQMHFKSPTLVMQTNITVVLPESEELFSSRTNTKLKTLYLFHGLSNDSSIYTRYTNIERYASSRNLAVVMPSVDLSLKTDLDYREGRGDHNWEYWEYAIKEVIGWLPLD